MTIVRWDDPKVVLWDGEAGSMREAVVAAVQAGATLRDANLRGADLGGATLRGAHLRGADLRGANLWGAHLGGAHLEDANLWGADLGGAHLEDADLRGADLRGADLGGANLGDADLRGAHLRGANLWGADLGGAHLEDADLRGADLGGARLPTGETWQEYLTESVPALLTADGQSLESFAPHWTCHDWTNCPMAHAFSVRDISAVPILLRLRAQQFIQFFDAGLISWPLPTKATA